MAKQTKQTYAVTALYEECITKRPNVSVAMVTSKDDDPYQIIREGVEAMLERRTLRPSELDGARFFRFELREGQAFSVTQNLEVA